MFFSSSTRYIGIDIGASAIKLVELENDQGRPRLSTYGISENASPHVLGGFDPRQSPARVAAAIKELAAASRTTTTKVVAALPSFSVFTSMVNIPTGLSKNDAAAAIRWEAKKIIPLPIEDMVLDWKILEDHEWRAPHLSKIESVSAAASQESSDKQATAVGVNSHLSDVVRSDTITTDAGSEDKKTAQHSQRVLVTAAAKQLVKNYIEIFRSAGLDLLSLETESFALLRSLVGFDQSIIMLVDVGAVNTDITIVDNGLPILNRSIDTGGITITQILSKHMQLSMSEAEQFKRDWSRQSEGKVPEIVEQALQPIINEMNYCISLYSRQLHALMGDEIQESNNGLELGKTLIEKIILTGGSSHFAFLEECIRSRFPIAVSIGNPWARVSFPKDLESQLMDIAPRLSVSIGLAMRNIE